MSHAFYCLKLSEASGFRRKKLNMRNKLVTLRLVQISKLAALRGCLEEITSQDTLSFH